MPDYNNLMQELLTLCTSNIACVTVMSVIANIVGAYFDQAMTQLSIERTSLFRFYSINPVAKNTRALPVFHACECTWL